MPVAFRGPGPQRQGRPTQRKRPTNDPSGPSPGPGGSGGLFTKAAPIATEPSIGAEQAHIADIDGNGIPTLVKMEGPLPGSFAREDGDFRSFRPFVQLPTGIRWASARVSLLDLNGDGRDDLLVVTDR